MKLMIVETSVGMTFHTTVISVLHVNGKRNDILVCCIIQIACVCGFFFF